MVRGTERLGERFREWAEEWFNNTWLGKLIRWFENYIEAYKARLETYKGAIPQDLPNSPKEIFTQLFSVGIGYFSYVVLNLPVDFLAAWAERAQRGVDPAELINTGGKWVSDLLVDVMGSDVVRETAEAIGGAVVDPVMELLLPEPGTEEIDGKQTARKFTGMILGMPLAGTILESVSGAIPGDIDLKFTNGIQSIYWGLGLGFLGWQTLSPALNIALQGPMERHYNRIYRPARFNLSTILDLFTLGEITAEEFFDRGAELGWRDPDLLMLLDAAARLPSRGDLRSFRDEGLITEEEHYEWLRKMGYSDPVARLILEIDRPEEETDALKTYRSTLKKALAEGLIDEAEFRQQGEALKWTEYQINLDIALVRLQREEALKRLAKSDVERAFKSGIYSENDARSALQEAEFSNPAIEVLLQTWRAEITSPTKRINESGVRRAVVAGVLKAERAIALLVDVGYPETDAQIVVETALRQMVKAPREATVGAYLKAYRDQYITLDEFREGLRVLGLSERAIALYETLATQTETAESKRPSESKAFKLYRTGRWTRQETWDYLLWKGYGPEDIEDMLWLEDREVAGSIIIAAYKQGFLPIEEAVQRLMNQGLTEPEALQALGEKKRIVSKADYLAGMILGLLTVSETNDNLVRIGYTREDAVFLTTSELWAVGPENTIRRYREGILDPREATYRLTILGFDVVDAERMLAEIELLPSRAAVTDAFRVGLLTVENGLRTLELMGMTRYEAESVLQTITREQEDKQVKALANRGYISTAEAILRLSWLGYTEAGAREYLVAEEKEE